MKYFCLSSRSDIPQQHAHVGSIGFHLRDQLAVERVQGQKTVSKLGGAAANAPVRVHHAHAAVRFLQSARAYGAHFQAQWQRQHDAA